MYHVNQIEPKKTQLLQTAASGHPDRILSPADSRKV